MQGISQLIYPLTFQSILYTFNKYKVLGSQLINLLTRQSILYTNTDSTAVWCY